VKKIFRSIFVIDQHIPFHACPISLILYCGVVRELSWVLKPLVASERLENIDDKAKVECSTPRWGSK
jgi:hypothetical protein